MTSFRVASLTRAVRGWNRATCAAPRFACVAGAVIAFACGGSSPTESGNAPPPPASPPTAPPTAPPPTTPANRLSLNAIAGTWVGVATDYNFPWTYRVKITIADSAAIESEAGAVVYSDSGFTNPGPLACEGTLTLQSVAGTTHRFRERLTSIRNCVNFGTVMLSALTRDTISYTWLNGQGVPATDTRLSRSTAVP